MKRRVRMDTGRVLQLCDEIEERTQAIREEVLGSVPEPPTVLVSTDAELHAALEHGGAIGLAAGVTFDGGPYVVGVSGTTLAGLGALLASASGPAVDVPCRTTDLAFADVALEAAGAEAMLIGRNDETQDTAALAPAHVRIERVTSSGHRGKRVIAVNASEVEIRDCVIEDVLSPEHQDSQAIAILNAPGPVLVEGGRFEAASECLMVGGDTMKIPGCRPSGITIRTATFRKRLEWQAAGLPAVKNLIELKDGHHVLIEACELSQCWQAAQDGFGFMFTPSNGASLVDVIVRRCRMWDVGGIVNVIGTDKSGINQVRSQITFDGGDYRTNKAQFGGRGCFALVGESPEWLIVDGCTIHVDGTAFVEIYDTKPVDLLRIVGCTWNYPKYGIRIGGYNHGEDALHVCGSIVIEGNTITGAASSFKSRYPNNTYVDAYRFGRAAARLRVGLLDEDRGSDGPPRDSD
jgi:hypothetical protein